MTRPIEHQSYGPGKFEGKSCIARFAYHVSLDGFGELIGEDENDNTERITGPFIMADVGRFERDAQDQMCLECVNDLLRLAYVDVAVSEQGFVYASA